MHQLILDVVIPQTKTPAKSPFPCYRIEQE
jgi:hypothetical protein